MRVLEAVHSRKYQVAAKVLGVKKVERVPPLTSGATNGLGAVG